MRVTVVTTAFNSATHLRECLKSVKNEAESVSLEGFLGSPVARRNRYRPVTVEHLVVDAASTDGTVALLESWIEEVGRLGPYGAAGSSRTAVAERSNKSFYKFSYLSAPDFGQSDGLNKGFRLAQGDWILWLNADDLLLHGALSAFRKELDEPGGDVDVVYGHYRFIGADGGFRRVIYTIPYSQFLVRHLSFLPPTSGTLFRKSVLISNPLDLTFHYTMDREWFLRCGGGLQAKRIQKEVAAFRVTEGSKTGKFTLYGEVCDQHRLEQQINWERHIEPFYAWLPSQIRRPVFGAVRIFCRFIVKVLKAREWAAMKLAPSLYC